MSMLGGRRVLLPVVAAFLVGPAALPWSASAQPARDAQPESASEEPPQPDAPAPQSAVAYAKSLDEPKQTIDGSSPTRRLTGVVVGPDDSPVKGAEVYVFARKSRKINLNTYAWPVERDVQRRIENPYSQTLRRARTDTAGRFAMELDPEWASRAAKLVAVSEGMGLGYEPLYQRLRKAPDQGDHEIRIRLPEMVPIRGRLLTPKGTPAAGVIVRVRQLVDWPRYDLIACQCRLMPSDPVSGTPAASANSTRDRSSELKTANQYLPEYWPRAVLTGADGSFRLMGIPAACRVYLTLMHPEFAQEALVVQTRPGELGKPPRFGPRPVRPEFTYTLRPAHPIEGTVTAADTGKPLSGILLCVSSVGSIGSWHGGGLVCVRTDQQGRYRVNCHEYLSHSIRVLPAQESGYLAVRTDERNAPEGVTRNFRLDRGKIIRGLVLDAETETPVRTASVVYRPSQNNSSHKGHYYYHHPVFTDADGQFAITGLSGPGYLLVETRVRSYARAADVGSMLTYGSARPKPRGLTPIVIPETGTLADEVVIRLKPGRTVTLQAIGPDGKKLPWVQAVWESNVAVFDDAQHLPVPFSDGKVVVRSLDPGCTTRVFLSHNPMEIGAVFDITQETGDVPIEVPLKPTATIVGRTVTADGKPAKDGVVTLLTSFDPKVSQFTMEGRSRGLYQTVS